MQMTTIYVAVGHFHIGDDPAALRAVASSLYRDAIDEFVRHENDEMQADVLEVEEIALYDNYGFPIPLNEAHVHFRDLIDFYATPLEYPDDMDVSGRPPKF